MLNRSSSKRNKTSKLYSLNDQPEENNENLTDDERIGDKKSEEKLP